MLDEKVVQPLLVTSSAFSLATECVRMILKVGHTSVTLRHTSVTLPP
jgi:chaperonin GroEL (HSP60 family)